MNKRRCVIRNIIYCILIITFSSTISACSDLFDYATEVKETSPNLAYYKKEFSKDLHSNYGGKMCFLLRDIYGMSFYMNTENQAGEESITRQELLKYVDDLNTFARGIEVYSEFVGDLIYMKSQIPGVEASEISQFIENFIPKWCPESSQSSTTELDNNSSSDDGQIDSGWVDPFKTLAYLDGYNGNVGISLAIVQSAGSRRVYCESNLGLHPDYSLQDKEDYVEGCLDLLKDSFGPE